MSKYLFKDIVLGEEGLLKGPFGSDLKKSLYVPKGDDTYKVYLQENILKEDNTVGDHYISKQYYNEKMSRYEVKENDFIVTCDGTLGEIFQIKNITEKGIISSSLLRITLNNEIVDDDYFYYLFKVLINKELITQGNNSVLKHLPGLNVIRNPPIYLPDLYKQKRIGRILKLIDTKIRNNDKINSELESMAKTIYDYWFLQFEFPNEDGKPYKSSGGKMVWNEELKREIPEGWEIKKVSEILSTIRQNKKINSSEYLEKGKYPIIDQSSEYICGFTNDEDALINFDDAIVFGDHTKILKYINFTFARGADGTQIINSNNEKLSNYLLYQQLHDVKLVSQGYSRYFKFLKEVKVVIPSKYIGEKYSDYINSLLKMRRNNIFENLHLTKLRDFLLPLLMNGQVGFKEDIGDEIRSKDIEEKELIAN